MFLPAPLARFRAVIFDMDGTLAHNIPFHKKAWLQMLRQHGIPLEANDFDAHNHGTGPEMVRRFFGAALPDDEVLALWQEKEETYRSLYRPHVAPVPGLLSLLSKLRASDVQIGLATMGIGENIHFLLDELRIQEYFTVITRGDEVIKGKPDPEVYLKTLAKLGLPATDCVAIEDSVSGVESAQKAGINVIALTTSGPASDFQKHQPLQVIDNFFDVL